MRAAAQQAARRFGPQPLSVRGERAAERYLRQQGYQVVGRGVRNLLGELDLVAVDGRSVVFVEVKTRASHDKGHPAEAVDADKQRRIARAALVFLRRHELLEHAARFDVIAITWPANARRPTIEHIRNAFEPPGRGGMFG